LKDISLLRGKVLGLLALCDPLVGTCGEGLGLGTGKWVDASTGAEALKAARRSSSSGEAVLFREGAVLEANGLLLPPFSKLSQN
jgi:hypothetical protein